MSLQSAAEATGDLLVAILRSQRLVPVWAWEVSRARSRGAAIGVDWRVESDALPEGLALAPLEVAEAMAPHDFSGQPRPPLISMQAKPWSLDGAERKAKRRRDSEGLREAMEMWEALGIHPAETGTGGTVGGTRCSIERRGPGSSCGT